MNLLGYLVVVAAGSAAVLAARHHPTALRITAPLALAACLAAAFLLSPGSRVSVGESPLVLTPYARAWLVAASGAFLFLNLLGMLTVWQRNIPLTMLAVLGTAAVALQTADPSAAFLALGAGAMLAGLGSLLVPIAMPSVRVAVDALRVAAVASGVAILAIGWVQAAGPGRASEPIVAGFVLMGLALAVRIGAFPFHTIAARLTQSAPLVVLPLLIAFVPALFATIALAWLGSAGAPVGAEAGPLRTALIVVALATLVLTGIAAATQDDLARVIAYGAVQDGAFVLLALVAAPEVSSLTGAWLIVYALARSAGFGLALALSGAFHSRAISELAGWARRSPPLGVALIGIAIASFGWPGLLPFDVRERLLRGAVGSLTPVALLVSALPLLGLLRLAVVGVQQPGLTVRRGFGARPVPVPFARPLPVRRSDDDAEGLSRTLHLLADAGREIRHAFVYLRVGWRLNRAPAAAVLVLVLSLLPTALALGLSELPALAAQGLPIGTGGEAQVRP
jgi:NADH:ubiquinone oxidoreductase subunit 2 (subunit N)